MFPIYSGTNSHPCQRNQMPSTQYYHPRWEGAPLQVKEDPPNSSSMHEPRPHNYGYPVPMQCHNCCSLGQHPAYYNFRPPCSHFPPAPAYNYFCGGVPPYPQSYPVYYAPPPHYSMELPRYEYEKSESQDQFHCHECPNHQCHVKGRNNVKIEEQEPDVEIKKSDSLFPAGAYNFPYPCLWIPPGYAMSKEQPRRLVENEGNEQQVLPYVKKPQMQQRSLETETQDNQGSPHGRKPHNESVQLSKEDPNLRYGWFPLDMNSIKQLMEGGDSRQTSNQENRSRDANTDCDVENKDQNNEISCPIIWMPYNGRIDNNSKVQEDKTTVGTTVEEPSSKVVSRKLEHADNKAEKGRTEGGDDDNRSGTLGADKKKTVKTIPVKQLDECKVDRAPVSNASQDYAKNGTSRQSSSPTKKSKLSPICLRVDPLKKFFGNGSSKYPIPPGDKSEQPHKEIKVNNVETLSQNSKIKVSPGAGEAKEGSEILKDKTACAERKLAGKADRDKPENAKSGDDSVQPHESQKLQAAPEGEFQQESTRERKVMSEMEAAVIIQSAYRGYHVRRWEPLEKLKQISKVHEEAVQVKWRIEDLESCAAVDYKEKAAIGEIIMNLLLKLDTIQGLHQSIRDVRRSMAKELILLQEKLDSIVSQKSATAQGAEESPKDSDSVEGSEGIIENLIEPPHDSSLNRDKSTKVSEEDGTSSNDLSSSQPSPCQDVVCSENKETSEVVMNLESQRGREGEPVVSSPSSGGATGLSLDMKKKEPDVSETRGENMPPPVDLVPRNKDQEANSLSELAQKVVDNPAIAGPVEDMVVQKDQEESLLLELPKEVGEDSLAIVSDVKDKTVQNDTVVTNTDQGADTLFALPREDKKEIPLTECDPASSKFASSSEEQPHQVASFASKERMEQETDLQINLPVEVISDDGKELDKFDTSGNFNKDQETDQCHERLDVVAKHESYEHSKDTLSGQDTEIVISPESIELPIMEEVESKLQESTGKKEAAFEAPPKENKDEVMKEGLQMSNAECNSGTTSLGDPFCRSEDVMELFAGDQENKSESLQVDPIETLIPEPDVRQSKEEYRADDDHTDKKILEENEKLKQVLEKLFASGKEQQHVISNLNRKVKDLEKKLARKKRVKSAKHPRVKVSRPTWGKLDNGPLGERPIGIAS